MKDYELKIISKLLDLASDEFSNHGCNDTPQEILDVMTPKELKELSNNMTLWEGDPDAEGLPGYDWLLMKFFKHRILDDLRKEEK